MLRIPYICNLMFIKYSVIQKDGLNWRVNGTSTHARQLVAVCQVLCSFYGLTCVGYAQNSLEFVSHSPLIHVVGRSFCLYTDSFFVQIGESSDNALPLWRLNVETKTKRTLHSSPRLTKLIIAKNIVLISSHFAPTNDVARLCTRRAL